METVNTEQGPNERIVTVWGSKWTGPVERPDLYYIGVK
jgi:hypothetical protein